MSVPRWHLGTRTFEDCYLGFQTCFCMMHICLNYFINCTSSKLFAKFKIGCLATRSGKLNYATMSLLKHPLTDKHRQTNTCHMSNACIHAHIHTHA